MKYKINYAIKIYTLNKREKLIKILNNTYLKNIQLGGANAVNNTFLDQFRELIICPISTSVMIDPVITSDGQTYDRENIMRWFAANNTSPLTNAILGSTEVVPNFALKQVIEHIINEGMLDMEVIEEYLTNLHLPEEEKNQRIVNIIRKKTTNAKVEMFAIPDDYQRIFITGLSLKYVYGSNPMQNDYYKEIVVALSNGKLIKITKVEGGEDSRVVDLIGTIVPHVIPVSREHFDHIVIFEQYTPESIKNILEQTLLSSDFYKIVKDDQLNNVKISPRIKFNPIFYTFMEYSNCMLMNKINNSLAIAPIARVPNLYDGIPKQIFSIYGNYGELYGATEEKVSELVKPSIQTLNESIGNTRYTLCGVVMEDISYIGKEIGSLEGQSWGKIVAENRNRNTWQLESGRIAKKNTEYERWTIKENYIIAVTGEKGIGKSYLTRQCIKPNLIFETDNCTQETFLAKYAEMGNRPVIVVGLRDPSFNLEFIKRQLEQTVYECKIVNLSDNINVEEEQRLKELRLEQEQRLEELRLEQERRQQEALQQQRVFVTRLTRYTQNVEVTIDGDTRSGTDYIYKLYLSDDNIITLKQDFDECHSGYTTATRGSMEIHKPIYIYHDEEDIVIDKIEYLGVTTVPNYAGFKDYIVHTLKFSDNRSIFVDENGGDIYYPSGSLVFTNFPEIDEKFI